MALDYDRRPAHGNIGDLDLPASVFVLTDFETGMRSCCRLLSSFAIYLPLHRQCLIRQIHGHEFTAPYSKSVLARFSAEP